jgi:hypothetical protein
MLVGAGHMLAHRLLYRTPDGYSDQLTEAKILVACLRLTCCLHNVSGLLDWCQQLRRMGFELRALWI